MTNPSDKPAEPREFLTIDPTGKEIVVNHGSGTLTIHSPTSFVLKSDYDKAVSLLREMSIKMQKLCFSIRADAMICDESNSRIGAGWAFIDDIKEPEEMLAKYQASRWGKIEP